jgi:glucose-6-phosphate 1-epimerase
VYTITLHGEQLRTDFRVVNTGDAPFEFTAALHTYFEVLGVDKARVRMDTVWSFCAIKGFMFFV